jgi:purine-binding chemotaxis protein CheW
MATTQLSTFRLDGHLFGIDVLRIQEVIRYQDMTPVPLAAPEVRGLINLRGQIVTAIDLRRRLSLPPRDDGSQPMNVVVSAGAESVSLLVDEIGDVLAVEAADFERPPETLDVAVRDVIKGAFKLDDELLLLLDTDRALALAAA